MADPLNVPPLRRREPRVHGAQYEALIDAFEAARGNGAENPEPSARKRRAHSTRSEGTDDRQTRTRRTSPPTTKPASPEYTGADARDRATASSSASHPKLEQDGSRAHRGDHGRDSTSMSSPAVTPPVPPTQDKASGASRAGSAPGLSLLQLEGEPKRSMRVRGNTIELEDGMPPLDITKRIKVRGPAGRPRRERGGADTPELDDDAPETGNGPVMLPGVAHSRLPNAGRAFKLPAHRVKSVEKDWNSVEWPDVEYELDADDEAWLSTNRDTLDLDEDSLECLLDQLEKIKAQSTDDMEVSWEHVASLVTDGVSTVTVAATVGWWQEKRRRHPAPLLRRLCPQTDFHDQNPDKCFRPQVPAPMSVRERTSSVDYRVIATGANQPLTQPAPAGAPALSPRKRPRTITARVQRLATSKIQIRPGCCITPPFLELTQPGPMWRDDAASVLDKAREMKVAKVREAQRKRAEADAIRERRNRPPTERGRQQREKLAAAGSNGSGGGKGRKAPVHVLHSGGLDLVVGATVKVKALEFGELHARETFGDAGWKTATYTGIVVTVVSNAQFDGADPRFEDGADVCMVQFDDGVFPVKPSMCTVLISPEQRGGGIAQLEHERQQQIKSAMPNINIRSGRISTGESPGKKNKQASKDQQGGDEAEETAKPEIFYSGDMVRCPQCKQLMKAPQSAYAWLLRSFHELLNCPC